jgi:hypothetical protein
MIDPQDHSTPTGEAADAANQEKGVPPEDTSKNPLQTPEKESNEGTFGTLQKALMRTFQGDIKTRLGDAASPAVAKFVPKTSPRQTPSGKSRSDREDASTAASNAREKKGPEGTVVRTFKDDIQNLVRSQKMSLARMAAMESDREDSGQGEQHEPWRTTTILALAGLFVVVGAVVAFGVYYTYQFRNSAPTVPGIPPSMIFTEAQERIDLTGKNPRSTVQLLALARRNTFFSLGSMIEFYLVRNAKTQEDGTVLMHLTSEEFLRSIDAAVPETFLQSLSEDYIVGLHVIDENIPFIVLTTSSYGHAFNGMFAWERHIEEDLAPFFSPSAGYIRPAAAEADNAFVDSVAGNLDVRILRDENRNVRILYSFVDRSTVVITTDLRTLLELASRLRVVR